MTIAPWHPFEYELKYRLGEITLGESHLNVLRKVYTLNEILSFTGDPELPSLPPDSTATFFPIFRARG